MNNTHQDRVALVTGANRGIGRAVASLLAERGFIVLIGARNVSSAEAIRGSHLVALDVTSAQSAADAAAWIGGRFGHLDVLVNNAGITGSGPVVPTEALDQVPSTVDVDMVRAVFETNVFGVITVTNAMLPLLRRSPAARIVNVSSGAGSLSLNADPDGPLQGLPQSAAYSPSKSALNALTIQYANELRKDGILVNAADPGYVDTEINAHTGFLTVEQGAAPIVHLATLGADGPTAGFFGGAGPIPW